MKKKFKVFLTFIIMVVITFTPFYLTQIKKRTEELFFRKEYVKTSFKIDSIAIVKSNIDSPSKAFRYEIYYNNENNIQLVNDDNVLIVFEPEKEHLNHFLETKKDVGDSILIWHHKKLEDKYAKEEDNHLNTDGYLQQIIFNTILLCIATCGIIWQVKEWRKP